MVPLQKLRSIYPWVFAWPGRKAAFVVLAIALGLTGLSGLSAFLQSMGADVLSSLMFFPIILFALYFGPAGGVVAAVALSLERGVLVAHMGQAPFVDTPTRIVVLALMGALVGLMGLHARLRSAQRLAQQQAFIDATPSLMQQERLNALSQVARGVVHDLNNALTPISGFSELVLANDWIRTNPDMAETYLRGFHSAVEEASAVVSRLRMLNGRDAEEADGAVVDMALAMEDAVLITEARWRAEARLDGTEITVRLNRSGDLFIHGSQPEFRSILTNLIFNAVDAMPEGGVLTIEGRAPLGSGTVELSVRDTGTGMGPEELRRCTEPFFTTKRNGTGLGLATTRGLVERYGGSMKIDSSPGIGTIITLQFPAAPGQPEFQREDLLPPVAPLRVLLVDDEPRVLTMLTAMLSADGHHVEAADNGELAVEKFASSPGAFDVVITDGSMPGLNGYELASVIKQRDARTWVVLISGFNLVKESDRPREIDAVLSKPVGIGALRAVLQQARPAGEICAAADAASTS